MMKLAEHHNWCAYATHGHCCGKSCDCGADDTNDYIRKMYSLLWKVSEANRVYTLDETHVAVFIDVYTAKSIEEIVGYDEMGQ